GNLEALDLRREGDAAVADGVGHPAAPLRQQIAEAVAAADHRDRAQHRVAAAEGEPRFVEPAALDALHREGDRSPRADPVDAELVAQAGGAEHGGGVCDAAQRTEREKAFVFEPDPAAVLERVDVLASDRAGDTAGARPRAGRPDVLG